LLGPLTATDEQIREGLNVLEHALGEVQEAPGIIRNGGEFKPNEELTRKQ